MGGIHPKENKFSAGKKIQIAELPKQVVIPLSHYIGTPSAVSYTHLTLPTN
jgi:electron transport complex protein RnfC